MPNFDNLARELMIRAVLWDVLTFVVGMLVLYYVIRAAVRDGVNASELCARNRWAQTPPPATQPAGRSDALPDLRAD